MTSLSDIYNDMAKRKLIKEVRDIASMGGLSERIDSSTAIRWFQTKLDYLFKKVPQREIDEEILSKRTFIRGKKIPVNERNMGKLYMFYYKPMDIKRLPYYDKFPLVIPFHLENNQFLGLNLHYLPPNYRTLFMERLYSYLNQRTLNENTRIRLSYKLIKNTVKLRYAKPCIRRYDYKWMRSRIINIPAEEWNIALHMPTERFKKQRKSKVWADTRLKIEKDKKG